MSERYLWKFNWDCGRQGSVSGLFVATEDDVKESIGADIRFGEILGKHSEVEGTLEEGEITKVDLDSETVEKVAKILGEAWSGYNPLDYIYRFCPECESRYGSWEWNEEKGMCDYCAEDHKEDED